MPRQPGSPGYRIEPFDNLHRQQVDWLELMHRQHTMHALLEADVTAARRQLRGTRTQGSEPVSLTAYIVWCLAQALAQEPRLHACRLGRGRLMLFDDVDIAVSVEREVAGARVPVPYIIRAAETKSPAQIHREIAAAKVAPRPQDTAVKWLPLWLRLPACLRRWYWTWLIGEPRRRQRLMGTAAVSSVAMFGGGAGWAVPLTAYALCLTVGGLARKPGVATDSSIPHRERIELRDMLALTLSLDHDLIDGAPAARFIAQLRRLIEAGCSTNA